MNKLNYLQKIKNIYLNGGNIIQYLKDIDSRDYNTVEDILISYDFQSGSYIKEYFKNPEFKEKYCLSLANIINQLGQFNSVIEIGVGEATTLRTLLKLIKSLPEVIMGFDISWSRIKFAKEFLHEENFNQVKLFTANLFEIPLPDNSVDIVYTSHSIEPNGGKEEAALTELYRITNKYLILLEPAYDLADEESRKRMLKLGYVTSILSTVQKLRYNVIEHRLFDHISNPLNPTGLTVIKKERDIRESIGSHFVCPVSRTVLKEFNGSVLYSPESFLAYPILNGIPCLMREYAIIATQFLTDYKEFKASLNK